MGNNPALLVDPDGLKFAYPVLLTGRTEHNNIIAAMEAEKEYKANGRLNDMSRHLSRGGMNWDGGRSHTFRMGVLEQFAMSVLAAGGQVFVATGEAEVSRNDVGSQVDPQIGNRAEGQQTEQGVDVYFKENPTLTMEKQDWVTTFVPSILEYAGQELQGEGSNRFMIMQYASYTFKIDALKDGIPGNFIKSLVNHYFKTDKFTSYQDAIDAGRPVFAGMPLGSGGHAELIIGYNTGSGQMIYMDPMKGAIDRNMPSFFYTDLYFPLIRNRNP
jgi:hypothetical protein